MQQHHALVRLLLSYSSGVLASISPCVLALLPLLLSRFLPQQRHPITTTTTTTTTTAQHRRFFFSFFPSRDVLLFLLGFQLSYLCFGFLLSSVFQSSVQNGIFLGAGGVFGSIGVLGLHDAVDPLHLPIFQRPLLFGVSFAALISVNPCTVPFMAVVFTLSRTDALLAMLSFAQGILTPALCFIALGSRFQGWIRKGISPGLMQSLNRLVNGILILTGVYLSWSLRILSLPDLLVGFGIRIAGFLFVLQRIRILFETQQSLNPLQEEEGEEGEDWIRLLTAGDEEESPTKPRGKKRKRLNAVDRKVLAVRNKLLALEILSAALSLLFFLIGTHSEITHEALRGVNGQLDAATAAAAGGNQDSSCVDLSALPPCWYCSASILVFTGAGLLNCGYIAWIFYSGQQQKADGGKERLSPSSVPPADEDLSELGFEAAALEEEYRQISRRTHSMKLRRHARLGAVL